MIVSKDKYLDHSIDGDLLKFYMSIGGTRNIVNLPICPRCEKIGFRDKGWAVNRQMACPNCGYRGVTTHVLSTYLNEGCYR